MVFSCEKNDTAFRHFHQVEVREMAARRNQPRRQQQFQAEATMTPFATGTQSSEGRKLLLAPQETQERLREIKRLHLVYVDSLMLKCEIIRECIYA